MKILVTGSSGFIGSHLVRKLAPKHKIVKYDIKENRDVLNETLLLKKLKDVDLVVHLAALISTSESWNKPREYMMNNAIGTLSVVRTSIKAGVKKIIFFSSASVVATPVTPYAVSKITAEKILSLYANEVDVIILRPENIYGTGQNESYGYVVHNFINAVKKGEKINIYGTGNQTRDFVFVEDVVDVVDKLLVLNIKTGAVISLGTGKSTKIIALAKLVMKIMKKKASIKFVKSRKEPFKSTAKTKVLKELGIELDKFVGLKSGIQKLL